LRRSAISHAARISSAFHSLRAPIERLAALDDVVHRPDRLFDRSVGIGAMAIDEVDVVQLQALQRAVDRIEQVLAVQRVVVVGAAAHAPVELGRHDELDARPGKLLQHLAHDDFAVTFGVDLGVVEEVDSGVERRSHQLARGAGVDLVAVGDPGAERQFGNFQAGAAEATDFHRMGRQLSRTQKRLVY